MITYYLKALTYIGVPYKVGGMDKTGMDCSGLVNAATGQRTRIWTTGAGDPPGNWNKLNIQATSHDGFIKKLQRGDLLVWKGHCAFFDMGERLLHARKQGTTVGFTNDLRLYWLKTMGYPTVYRQR
jgi:cell wall-associated NlpC family hydrolase